MNKRKTLFAVTAYHSVLLHQPIELSRQARWRFIVPVIILALVLILTLAYFSGSPKPIISYYPKSSDSQMKPNPAPARNTVTAKPAVTDLPPLTDKKFCPHGTVLVTVAHQDDDILFMNPAVQQSIGAGWCIRTVYVTAGDDGNDSGYWLQREQGPLAAYATMFGAANQWTSQTSSLNGHPITHYSLESVPRVSLVFLRLPDGNVQGQGFASTNNVSLRKLRNGDIPTIGTVDSSSSYSRADLINTLRRLISLDKPKVIDTQAFSAGLALGDHSDHQAVGYFTSIAAAGSGAQPEVHRFIGYQAGGMDPNLTDQQAADKLAIFSAYDQQDPMVCNAEAGCFNSFLYLRFISRQYEQANPGF